MKPKTPKIEKKKYRIVTVRYLTGKIKWQKRIYNTQKKKLSICPKCKKRFYYWQDAHKHAEELNHYGDYSI